MTPVYLLPSLLDSTLKVQRGKPGTAASAAAGDAAESAARLGWLCFAKCFIGSRCRALCACVKVPAVAHNAIATKQGNIFVLIVILLTDAGLDAWDRRLSGG